MNTIVEVKFKLSNLANYYSLVKSTLGSLIVTNNQEPNILVSSKYTSPLADLYKDREKGLLNWYISKC